MQKDKELFDSMRNIVILNSLHFSYPLPILMRVSYNTLIVKQNTSDYYKYTDFRWILEISAACEANLCSQVADKRFQVADMYPKLADVYPKAWDRDYP